MRQFRLNMYIPVSHTNRRPIKNLIGMVMNLRSGFVPLEIGNCYLAVVVIKMFTRNMRRTLACHEKYCKLIQIDRTHGTWLTGEMTG